MIVVNPLRETGLVRFKVPSDVRSLLFGSKIADEYVQPHIGGDIAFLSGVAKRVSRDSAPSTRSSSRERAEEWDAFRQSLEAISWPLIEERSGVGKEVIDRVADTYARAGNAVFCWAMGITHHEHGVQNVQAIANLAMTRGMFGQAGTVVCCHSAATPMSKGSGRWR